MIKVGISGTNWTGKTTTMQRLLSKGELQGIRHISLSPIVRSCPYPTVQRQTLEASQWVIKELRRQESDFEDQEILVLYDRTPLDILAFTVYAFERTIGKQSQTIFDQLFNDIKLMLKEYERIFFLPSPKDGSWPPKKQSAADIRFALKMEDYLRRGCSMVADAVIEDLPWDLNERVDRLVPSDRKRSGKDFAFQRS